MAMALEGIRVLDLTRLAPGPFCTWILGDLGADVLRIEEPPSTDRSRRMAGAGGGAPSGADTPSARERRLAFDVIGRNKRSMYLNLQKPEAREVFYRLARQADVVVEGFRPGVVQRLGVDYETLRPMNPRLVYCSISGYGQTGPYRLWPGHDINYISLGGALSIIGLEEDGQPAIPANLIADFAGGGLTAAAAIMAALLARERTGQGQYIDIAMAEGALGLMATMTSAYFASGAIPTRGTGPLTGGRAHYHVYRTKDGEWVSLGSLEPHFFATTCRLLGCEEFIPYQNDPTKQQEMVATFQRIFATRTRAEWMELFAGQEVCFMPVHDLGEALNNPHIRERGMVWELQHPTVGAVQQLASPFHLSETPPAFRFFAAAPGEHTDEVLRELGYDAETVRHFHETGVVE